MNLVHKAVQERVSFAILSMAQTYGLEQGREDIAIYPQLYGDSQLQTSK